MPTLPWLENLLVKGLRAKHNPVFAGSILIPFLEACTYIETPNFNSKAQCHSSFKSTRASSAGKPLSWMGTGRMIPAFVTSLSSLWVGQGTMGHPLCHSFLGWNVIGGLREEYPLPPRLASCGPCLEVNSRFCPDLYNPEANRRIRDTASHFLRLPFRFIGRQEVTPLRPPHPSFGGKGLVTVDGGLSHVSPVLEQAGHLLVLTVDSPPQHPA